MGTRSRAPVELALGRLTYEMDQQPYESSLSWVAQQVLLLLADSRTGATATQLSGQLFMPREQVDDALGELLEHGHASRSGRRWRPILPSIVRSA
jgi:hypothetical protein